METLLTLIEKLEFQMEWHNNYYALQTLGQIRNLVQTTSELDTDTKNELNNMVQIVEEKIK